MPPALELRIELALDAWLDPGFIGAAADPAGSSAPQLSQIETIRISRWPSLLSCDRVSREDIEHFKELWAEFDPRATNTIAAKDLPQLVRQLEAPMCLRGAPMRWVVRVCLNLGLAHVDGKVGFEDVLNALVSHNYRTQMQEDVPYEFAQTDGALRLRARKIGGRLWEQGELSQPQRELARVFAMAITQMHVRNMRREIASKYGSYSKMRAANRSQPSAAGGRSALGGASVLMSAGYDDLTSTKPTTLEARARRDVAVASPRSFSARGRAVARAATEKAMDVVCSRPLSSRRLRSLASSVTRCAPPPRQ